MCVQALAAQLAVEGLDERVVCGRARAGEVRGHTALVSPQIHVSRDKLAAIVHPDCLGLADLLAGLVQRGNHVLTPIAEPGIDHRRWLGVGIDHRQDAQLPAGRQLVMHKVHRLHIVRSIP